MCQQENETTTHILRCQNINMGKVRAELMTELKQWLIQKETQSDIVEFLGDGLESWFQSERYEINENVDSHIRIAFESQILIGWESLLHGFMSKKLIMCQQLHYTSLKRRKLGTRWGIMLTIKLWQIIQKLWIHRNSVLHETEAINLVSGKEHLTEAVFLEHLQGLDNLPNVYAPYFLTPLENLLNKPITQLKQWFLVVRTGRESIETETFTDIFATDPSLRKWTNLPPIK